MKKEIEALYNTICDELKDGWKENSIGSFKDFIKGMCQLLKELIDTYYVYHEWKEGHEFPEKDGKIVEFNLKNQDLNKLCYYCKDHIITTSTGAHYCVKCGFVEPLYREILKKEKKNPKCPDCGGNTHSLQSVGKPDWYQCDSDICGNYTFEWTPT